MFNVILSLTAYCNPSCINGDCLHNSGTNVNYCQCNSGWQGDICHLGICIIHHFISKNCFKILLSSVVVILVLYLHMNMITFQGIYQCIIIWISSIMMRHLSLVKSQLFIALHRHHYSIPIGNIKLNAYYRIF